MSETPSRAVDLAGPLSCAFDRIDDFLAVQASRAGPELLGAVICLQGSVAIDDAARQLVRERVSSIKAASQAPGPFMLGLVVGLMAAELRDDG